MSDEKIIKLASLAVLMKNFSIDIDKPYVLYYSRNVNGEKKNGKNDKDKSSGKGLTGKKSSK